MPGQPRKTPHQQRALRTIDAILDAAARILDNGEQRFTTNHVAALAGCSIGTLYQYFKDKDAILFALFERERRAVGVSQNEFVHRMQQGERGVDMIEAVVDDLLDTFSRRRDGWRREMLVSALMDRKAGPALLLDDITDSLAKLTHLKDGNHRLFSPEEAYVLTRALKGTLILAALEDSPMFERPAFRAALVKLLHTFPSQT